MVDMGNLEPQKLWQYVKVSKQNELDSREKYVAFESKLNSTALAFGGNVWRKLKRFMLVYIKNFPSGKK